MSNYYYKSTCINCGSQVKELFRKYSASVLKLVNCENCKDVADKYIEYDPVIVIIDLILLRKEAYRHILYNTEFESYWKLAVMLQMMEVYSEWILILPKQKVGYDKEIYNKEEVYNAVDIQFYLLSLKVLFRTICSTAMVLLLTIICNKLFRKKINTKTTLKTVLKAVILSNFGWFLLLPSLIWDNSVQEFHLMFILLYTTLSQLLAYSVVCNCTKIWSIIVIVLSYNCKMYANELYDTTYNFFINEYSFLFK